MAELPKYFYFRVTPVTNKGVLTQVMLEDASNADVVEVVRCSVCKHVLLEKQADGTSAYWCPVHKGYRCYDEFCNRGEPV